MTSTPPTPDSPARRTADLAHIVELFIDDEPQAEQQPARTPLQGPPCVP